MADLRKGVECDYCGAAFHIKFPEDVNAPQFCCFCSEPLDGPEEVADEEDDGDLDYTDDELEEDE
jgi:hypothetical protein